MFCRPENKRGFTLIELLVVIAVIGLLSSAILASLSEVREKGRDARRLSDIEQIQRALALYYDDNGTYPQISNARTASTDSETCSGGGTIPGTLGDSDWCQLIPLLEPYLLLPNDPLGPNADHRYWYDSNAGDNWQTYGLMIEEFESEANFPLAANDGGAYNDEGGALDGTSYEVGDQPTFCAQNYTDTDANWLSGDVTKVCNGSPSGGA